MRAYACLWAVLLLASVTAGCGKGPGEEAAVRAKFAEVQVAIRDRDADKLWGLSSTKSQADAEKEAKGVRTAYEEADPEGKAQQEKALGLPGAELAKLTGAGFLKTKVFLDKRGEIADSTLTRVTAEGDSATVYFDEPDGDKEKLVFVREGGQWKAWLGIPKVKRP